MAPPRRVATAAVSTTGHAASSGNGMGACTLRLVQVSAALRGSRIVVEHPRPGYCIFAQSRPAHRLLAGQ